MSNRSRRKLVIVGAGGFGREVLELVRDVERSGRGDLNPLGFLDDNPELAGATIGELPVLGGTDWLALESEPIAVAIAVGAPQAKLRILKAIGGRDVAFPVLIHPSAVVGRNVALGRGVIVCAGNVLTCDIGVGDFVTCNLACTVGHDASIGDFTTMSPGVRLSGGVRVREGVELGTSAAVVPGVEIGAWGVVGAGAVVARDLPPNAVSVGVPARAIKTRPEGWHLG